MIKMKMIDSRLAKLRLPSKLIDSFESYFSDEPLRCPRCGAEMKSVGSEMGCLGIHFYSVVPPILVLKCPQCGYEERSLAC